MSEQQPAQCPFTKQACIRERCELYTRAPVVSGSQLVGMAKSGVIQGCTFNLTTHFLGQIAMISTVGPRPPGSRAS